MKLFSRAAKISFICLMLAASGFFGSMAFKWASGFWGDLNAKNKDLIARGYAEGRLKTMIEIANAVEKDGTFILNMTGPDGNPSKITLTAR